jgi:hypothetical protein
MLQHPLYGVLWFKRTMGKHRYAQYTMKMNCPPLACVSGALLVCVKSRIFYSYEESFTHMKNGR